MSKHSKSNLSREISSTYSQLLLGKQLEDKESKRVKKLVTHVPDFVIKLQNYDNEMPKTKEFLGVVLFADISGFTALTEKYSTMISSDVSSGTDKLSATLNAYIGKIVDEIIKSGGDVLKFAGDAILATWKCSDIGHDAKSQLNKVINCSIDIQANCENYETEVGIVLRVKLAIAVGSMCLTNVGLPEVKHFDISGSAIDDVGLTEKLATPGSIILSQIAWANCEQNFYEAIQLEKGKYFQVSGHAQKRSINEDSELDAGTNVNTIRQHFERFVTSYLDELIDEVRDYTFDMPKALLLDGDEKANTRTYLTTNTLAPAIPAAGNQSSDKNFDRITLTANLTSDEIQHLRSYVPETVLYKIDHEQELDWLSEMRQVSVLFINMKLPTPPQEAARALQKAFEVIYEACVKYQGNVNKVFGFDKGCTFVVIFGLPGQKREDDPIRALKCADYIFDSLQAIPEIHHVSIGVTTGAAFCGVVGHKHRHEYTVIGSKVNMAARLMMYYPKTLTCDDETYDAAKLRLRKQDFTPMPYLELKGLKDPGTVREYNPNSSKKDELDLASYPILGRIEELDQIDSMLQKYELEKNASGQVIIIEGDVGIGKTKLLEEVITRAEKKTFRLINVEGELAHAQIPNYLTTAILNTIVDVEGVGREKFIRALIQDDSEMLKNIGLLNEIIGTDTTTKTIKETTNKERQKHIDNIIVRLLNLVTTEQPLLITIDNSRYVDKKSWERIGRWIDEVNVTFVIVVRTLSLVGKLCAAAVKVLTHQRRHHVFLGGLNDNIMVSLICQILEVCEVPRNLCQIINTKSQGVPSWCEQLLKDMIDSNHIQTISKSVVTSNSHRDKNNIDLCSMSTKKYTPSNKPSINDMENSENGTITSTVEGKIIVNDEGEEKDGSTNQIVEATKTVSATYIKEAIKGFTYNEQDYIKASSPVSSYNSDQICIITPGIDLERMLLPDSMKEMVLARMDRMTLSEQTVLKCAAVLGQTFTRDLLKAIIPTNCANMLDTVLHNLGKQKIFECGSLSLVRSQQRSQSSFSFARLNGGVSKATGRVGEAFSKVHHNGSHGIHNNQGPCGCYVYEEYPTNNISQTGYISDDKKQICLFFQFCNTFVQEAAHALWLEDQRKSLYEKAAIHLERLSSKCKSCGGNGFIPGHGIGVSTIQHMEHGTGRRFSETSGSRSISKTTYNRGAVTNQQIDSIENTIKGEAETLRKHAKSEHLKNYEPKGTKGEATGLKLIHVARLFTEVRNEPKKLKTQKFSIFTSRRRIHPNSIDMLAKKALLKEFRESINVPCNSSIQSKNEAEINVTVDLRQCQCSKVRAYVLPQLVHYWKVAGNAIKTYQYTIDAAAAEIGVGKNMKALGLLKDVDKMAQKLRDNEHLEFLVTDQKNTRIECLKGQALCNMDLIDEGITHFYTALQLLKIPQPTNTLGIMLRTWKALLIQKLHQKMPGVFTDSKSDNTERAIDQARCLSYLFKAYMLNNDPERAHLAVLEQLNAVEESCLDQWCELMTAYINIIEYCKLMKKFSTAKIYEKLALENAKFASGNFEDMLVLGQLYLTLTSFHLRNADINNAQDTCQMAYQIATKINDLNLKIRTYPIIINIYLLKFRVQSCKELLLEFKEIVMKLENDRAKFTYYCCFIDYFIVTGDSFEQVDEILKFSKKKDCDDGMLTYYLKTGLSLILTRENKWETAELVYQELGDIPDNNSSETMFCRLLAMHAEYHLHKFRKDLNNKSRKNAQRALKTYRNSTKGKGLFQPRLHHLQAYLAYIRKKNNRAKLHLEDCVVASKECAILFDYEWALASKRHWFQDASNANDLEKQLSETIRYTLPKLSA